MTTTPMLAAPVLATNLLDHLSQPAWICAADGALIHANPALLARTGQTLAACLAGGLGGLFEPGTRQQSEDQLLQHFQSDRDFGLDCPLNLAHPDPVGCWHRLRAWREPASAGGPSVWVILAESRSQATSVAATPAEVSTRLALDQFTAVAAHDLQEPLRMVSGFLALLKRKYGPVLQGPGLEYLTFALDGAERMQVLLRRMFEYAQVSGPQRHLTRIDADQILREALIRLQPQITTTAAEITSAPLPVLVADREQLGMLFYHLLENAMTFQPKGQKPVVQIDATRSAQLGWVISVRDNGIGIAAADHDRVFAPFQRLHTRAEYPGTGLGLTICDAIVRGHGGRMWLESPGLGQGATVFASLPSGSQRLPARPS